MQFLIPPYNQISSKLIKSSRKFSFSLDFSIHFISTFSSSFYNLSQNQNDFKLQPYRHSNWPRLFLSQNRSRPQRWCRNPHQLSQLQTNPQYRRIWTQLKTHRRIRPTQNQIQLPQYRHCPFPFLRIQPWLPLLKELIEILPRKIPAHIKPTFIP